MSKQMKSNIISTPDTPESEWDVNEADGLGLDDEQPLIPNTTIVKSNSCEEVLDQKIEEDIKNIIKCSVCFEVPVPLSPLYQDFRGHISCNSCKLKSGYWLWNPYFHRNLVAEKIATKCTLRCKHVEQGCTMICKGPEMLQHLGTCSFRPVKCTGCDEFIDFKAYPSHLNNVHHINDPDSEHLQSDEPPPLTTGAQILYLVLISLVLSIYIWYLYEGNLHWK